MTEIVMTREIAQKVVETVDKGLSSGLGKPIPGQMCVEAAVCYAMGMPHDDTPNCVGPAVRMLKIQLNDANWSSNGARAKGMRRVAVAQLGSDQIDQKAFAQEVTLQVTRQLLPIALQAAASWVPAHAAALKRSALACEALVCFADVRKAAVRAQRIAEAAACSAAGAASYAAKIAHHAACAAVTANDANDANDAALYAANVALCTANVALYAANGYYAADTNKAMHDVILSKAAEIGVQALAKLGAQGAQWLDLCD